MSRPNCSWEVIPAAIASLKEVNVENFISEMTNFMLNWPLYWLFWYSMYSHRWKHSKNCYLTSPAMQSQQNLIWPVATEDVQWSITADNGMIRWICDMSLNNCIPVTNLLLCLGLSSINEMLHWNRLRFHGHFLHMDDNAWPKKAIMHYDDGKQPRSQPRKWLCDVLSVKTLTTG